MWLVLHTNVLLFTLLDCVQFYRVMMHCLIMIWWKWRSIKLSTWSWYPGTAQSIRLSLLISGVIIVVLCSVSSAFIKTTDVLKVKSFYLWWEWEEWDWCNPSLSARSLIALLPTVCSKYPTLQEANFYWNLLYAILLTNFFNSEV